MGEGPRTGGLGHEGTPPAGAPRGSPGSFDFLDVGCLQGLASAQRLAEGRSVSALANPGATVLVLAFQRTPVRSLTGGVSQADVGAACAGWELLSVEPAGTAGLGWPLSRTAPQWYRLRRPAQPPGAPAQRPT